jgi:hypothetical protein
MIRVASAALGRLTAVAMLQFRNSCAIIDPVYISDPGRVGAVIPRDAGSDSLIGDGIHSDTDDR